MTTLFWMLAAGVCAVMLSPFLPEPPFEHADKIVHCAIFAALAFAAGLLERIPRWRSPLVAKPRELSPEHLLRHERAMMAPGAARPLYRRTEALLFVTAIAVVLEAAHDFLPQRSADLLDLLANLVGVALGWTAAAALRPHVMRWRSRPVVAER